MRFDNSRTTLGGYFSFVNELTLGIEGQTKLLTQPAEVFSHALDGRNQSAASIQADRADALQAAVREVL